MQHWIQCNTLKCLFACMPFLFSFSSFLPYISFLLQLLHLRVTLEFMKASTLMGHRQGIFSEGFVPVEHTAVRDKTTFCRCPANDRVVPGSMLWDTLSWGLFPLEDEMKASSSIMKDLLFVLHAVLPRYCND